MFDDQGKVLRFNRAAEQLTGYSFAELEGRYFWDVLLLPEDESAVKTIFAALLAGEGGTQHENYWRTRSGGRRLIAFTNKVLREGGKPTHVIVTGIDVL